MKKLVFHYFIFYLCSINRAGGFAPFIYTGRHGEEEKKLNKKRVHLQRLPSCWSRGGWEPQGTYCKRAGDFYRLGIDTSSDPNSPPAPDRQVPSLPLLSLANAAELLPPPLRPLLFLPNTADCPSGIIQTLPEPIHCPTLWTAI